MIKMTGDYSDGVIMSEDVEQSAVNQIQEFLNHPITENANPVFMPDYHAGAGAVIGTTMKVNMDCVVPNVIGVDIGCGMLAVKTKEKDIDFQKLDNFIYNHIPHGRGIHKELNCVISPFFKRDLKDTIERTGQDYDYVLHSIGSLGGGNHFIELAKDKSDNVWIIIHSGSRNFGLKIANFYQKLAQETCTYDCPKPLKFLSGENSIKYLTDMRIAQEFATNNRNQILSDILIGMDWKGSDDYIYCIESVHNYIGTDNIIRKGAISAYEGNTQIIPLNMAAGSLIVEGKSNPNWNCSAPHGAGRVSSRTDAKKNITMGDFKESMEGIYSSCIKESTLDEAPMAYKSKESIIKNIGDTVEIVDHLIPIYNFKA